MRAIVIIIISIGCIKCSDDFCDFIQSNGTYNEIQIQHKSVEINLKIIIPSYEMYSKGMIWEFTIESDAIDNTLSIVMKSRVGWHRPVEGHISIDCGLQYHGRPKIVNQFMGPINRRHNTNIYDRYCCDVSYKNWQMTEIETDCYFRVFNNRLIHSIQFNPKSIIFRTINDNSDDSYHIVLDTTDRSVRVLRFAFNGKSSQMDFIDQNDCKYKECRKPVFINQIPNHMMRLLKGIVDYYMGPDMRGHMLWFNISGQPRYCFTPDGKPLSQQCSSIGNLVPFGKQCIPGSETPDTQPMNSLGTLDSKFTHLTPPDISHNKNISSLLILFIISLILIVLVLVILYSKHNNWSTILYKTFKDLSANESTNIKLNIS